MGKNKKQGQRVAPAAASVAAVPAAAPAPVPAGGPETGSDMGDSGRWAEEHPTASKLILVAVWLYVAALALLAIDQWFNLGIFGPKVPPTP